MSGTRAAFSGRRAQAGRTVVELLISMVLGLVVLGAVMNSVATSGVSGRAMQGLSKLNEDAQVALNLVSSHVRMAGFSSPRINGIPGLQANNFAGAPIRACDAAFLNPAVAGIENLACAGVDQPNAFAIAYEADQFNSLMLVPGQPTDCLGQALPAQVSPFGGNFFLAENRFFIRNGAGGDPELACAGIGDNFAAPQTLVRNVEDLRLTFGTGDLATGAFGNQVYTGRVSNYLTADELDAHPVFSLEPMATRWRRVSSVRICLQVRSEDGMTDEPTPYVDCFGNLRVPADRRVRVAVTSTVNLRNTSDAAL